MISVATWNINSVRFRIEIVERFLREHAPDILCLQETKVIEGLFPHAAFGALGYHPRALHGQKGITASPSSAACRCARTTASTGRPIARRGMSGRCWCRTRRAAGECLCPRGRRRARPRGEPQIRPEARFRRADDALVRRARPARRSWPATSTSRRSNATCGATSSCSTSSATRRSRSRRWRGCRRPRLGRSRPPFHPAPAAAATPGGAIAPRTGRRTTAAGGSIICGRPPTVARHAAAHQCSRSCRNWLKPSDHVPIMTEFAL